MPYKKTIVRREKIQEFYGTYIPLMNEYAKMGAVDQFVETAQIPDTLQVTQKLGYYLNDKTKLGIVKFPTRINGNYGTGYFTVLPHTAIEEVEYKTVLEIAEPILNRMMPEHWCYYEGYLCLHYPQINITNTTGTQYTVYDIVVALAINDARIEDNLKGWKYTYTQEELQDGLNFIHPHLEKGRNRQALNFCLGGSSPFYKWLQANKEDWTEEKFTMLLYQIKDYLEWESLEGKPYYSIDDFDMLQEQQPYVGNSDVEAFTKILIQHLTPDMLTNGIIEPSLISDKLITLEQQLISSGTLPTNFIGDYHEATNRFVQVRQNSETSHVVIPEGNTLIKEVQTKLGITERVLPNPVRNLPPTTKRIYTKLFRQSIGQINHLLKLSSSL